MSVFDDTCVDIIYSREPVYKRGGLTPGGDTGRHLKSFCHTCGTPLKIYPSVTVRDEVQLLCDGVVVVVVVVVVWLVMVVVLL